MKKQKENEELHILIQLYSHQPEWRICMVTDLNPSELGSWINNFVFVYYRYINQLETGQTLYIQQINDLKEVPILY